MTDKPTSNVHILPEHAQTPRAVKTLPEIDKALQAHIATFHPKVKVFPVEPGYIAQFKIGKHTYFPAEFSVQEEFTQKDFDNPAYRNSVMIGHFEHCLKNMLDKHPGEEDIHISSRGFTYFTREDDRVIVSNKLSLTKVFILSESASEIAQVS